MIRDVIFCIYFNSILGGDGMFLSVRLPAAGRWRADMKVRITS